MHSFGGSHFTVTNRELCFADSKSRRKNFSSYRSFGQNAMNILIQESTCFLFLCFVSVVLKCLSTVVLECYVLSENKSLYLFRGSH
jgi:hypothetical protein